MNTFLSDAQKVYQNLLVNPEHYKKVRIVIGNESCDLDSAISALVYGYILYHEAKQTGMRNYEVVPLLNILHDDLPLKTEVNYFLKLHGITPNAVPTRGHRDQLNLNKMSKAGVLELTLVDHHTLPPQDQDLVPSVVEIIDHRPQEPGWDWPNADVTITKVGSCCTLITKKILDRIPHLMSFQLCFLLYGPIVLDTFNFSEEAGRTTKLDLSMASALDYKIAVDREKLFNDLIFAKTCVDGLSDIQIVRKDLKIVGGIPIAGLPMLIEDLLKRPSIDQSLTYYCKTKCNFKILLLMGVKVTGENVEKDLGIFSLYNCVSDFIFNNLESNSELSLNLSKKETNLRYLKLYKQNNIKMSRKQISPVILSLSQTVKDIASKSQTNSLPTNRPASVKV